MGSKKESVQTNAQLEQDLNRTRLELAILEELDAFRKREQDLILITFSPGSSPTDNDIKSIEKVLNDGLISVDERPLEWQGYFKILSSIQPDPNVISTKNRFENSNDMLSAATLYVNNRFKRVSQWIANYKIYSDKIFEELEKNTDPETAVILKQEFQRCTQQIYGRLDDENRFLSGLTANQFPKVFPTYFTKVYNDLAREYETLKKRIASIEKTNYTQSSVLSTLRDQLKNDIAEIAKDMEAWLSAASLKMEFPVVDKYIAILENRKKAIPALLDEYKMKLISLQDKIKTANFSEIPEVIKKEISRIEAYINVLEQEKDFFSNPDIIFNQSKSVAIQSILEYHKRFKTTEFDIKIDKEIRLLKDIKKNQVRHLQNKLKASSHTDVLFSGGPKGPKPKGSTEALPVDKYVVFACHVPDHGIGDLGHFMDVVKSNKEHNLTGELKPVYIITTAWPASKILDILKENNFDLEANPVHVVSSQDPISLEKYIDKNIQGIADQLEKTTALFNISTLEFSPSGKAGSQLQRFFKSKNKTVPCTSIVEHGFFHIAISNTDPNHNLCCMGFSPNEQGVFLKKPQTHKNKAENLSKIKDQTFLNTLLKRGGHPSTPTADEAADFLNDTLLIPCYFQEGSENFIALMNAVANSPLAAKYKEIVFVTNKNQTYPDRTKYANVLSGNINKITFNSKDQDSVSETTVNNLQATPSVTGKNIRVIEGFWLNQADHDTLYQCAQVFGGCSGDKSLEQVLSHGLVPLLQIRTWKMVFVKELISYAQCVLENELAKGEKNHVAEYLKELLELRLFISKVIFQKEKLTTITPQQTNSSAYEAQVKVIEAIEKKISDISAKMASILTPEMQVQWNVLLKDMHENFNLYDKLPSVIQSTLARAEQTKAPQKHNKTI